MNKAGSSTGPKGLTRREALVLLGVGGLVAEQALLEGPSFGSTAGRAATLPLSDVELLASPFLDNQARNTAYLLFLDPERMLRPFRLNYGLDTQAQPCGGWEQPASEVRGHRTGHLMSALALTYANTGNDEVLARGRYLVGQLAAMQARAPLMGFHPGYLSGFPESFFDVLEQGKFV